MIFCRRRDSNCWSRRNDPLAVFENPLEIQALKSGHHSIEKESRWRRQRKKASIRWESNLRPLDQPLRCNNRSPTQTFSSKNNVPRIRQKYVFDNMCPIPGRIFFVFNPSESFFLSIFAFADLAWLCSVDFLRQTVSDSFSIRSFCLICFDEISIEAEILWNPGTRPIKKFHANFFCKSYAMPD